MKPSPVLNPQTRTIMALCLALASFGPLSYAQWCQSPILPDVPVNSNQQPRYDTSGNIVDAHDGMLVQFGNTYYLYGTSYGQTGGFSDYNYFSVYSSSDLVTWTKQSGNLLNYNPANKKIFFRPHVIYNSQNNTYVMWYNWFYGLDNGYNSNQGYLAVATSSSPTGPFTIQNEFVKEGAGDLNVFVDNDANSTAYLIYTMLSQSFQIYIERLDSTYQSLTGNNIALATGEAPILFKKDSTYYTIIGTSGCCYCSTSAFAVRECQGTSPLGTWSSPPSGFPSDLNAGYFIPGQPTYVAKISTSLAGDRYVLMADLWSAEGGCFQTAGDRGLDPQYWTAPLEFVSGHIEKPSRASNTGYVSLLNASGQTWGDSAQVVAIPSDGSSTVTLGTLSGSWAPGATWTMSLAPLVSGKSYTIELQDIFNGTISFVPSEKFITAGASLAISGYIFRVGTGGYWGGGYWGWYANWDGPRMLDLVNQAGQTWGDARQVRAIPTDNSASIVLDYQTASWNAGAIWSMDVSKLTFGKYYNIVLEDIFNGATNEVPSTNYVAGGWSASGFAARPGGGGYAGWFNVWDGHPSTITLFNDYSQTWGDNAQIVAYLNNAGSPIVIGSRSGSWYSTQPWTLSLAPLTIGCSYTFELQDTSFGDAVIPPRSNLIPMMSNQAYSNGYVWNAGSGGYFGWYTVWGW